MVATGTNINLAANGIDSSIGNLP